MKNLIIATLLVFAMATFVMAEDTGGANWNDPSLNREPVKSVIQHSHAYEEYEPEMQLGAGVDVVLYESELIGIEAQNKWDFANENYEGYLVGKINLWNLGKKILKK